MNPWLSSVLASHLLDRRQGHRRTVLQARRQKQAFDFVPPEQRRAVQAEALARLLNHCRLRVPFYRQHLASMSDISPANAWDVLSTLPIVSRADVQQQPDAFVAEGVLAAAEDATGGSTGTPMRFKVDRSTQIARESSLMWADSLAGWHPGERIAMLWGADRDVKSARRTLRLAIRWWIENRRWFDAFRMDEKSMIQFHKAMRRFRPHYLVAYASALELFADFLRGRGIRPEYPIRALISSAEVLMPVVREKIEQVFQRPVFDRYGNREFGAIAAECSEHAGLHVNPCDMIVELLPLSGDGTMRRVVITYLANAVMPFVRYDTEDVAEPAERLCVCGRTTDRLLRLVGRRSDMIRLKDGRWIHGEFFTHMFYGIAGVRRFQFVQKSVGSFEMKVMASPEVFAQHEASWRERLRESLGPEARVELFRVDNIEPTASGKYRFTTSCDAAAHE